MATSQTSIATVSSQSDSASMSFFIEPIEPFKQEYICHQIPGIDEWGVYERRYSAKWLLVARCISEGASRAIVSHLNASIRTLGGVGVVCVPICSIDKMCQTCHGKGHLDQSGNPFCPVTLELWEQVSEIEEFGGTYERAD